MSPPPVTSISIGMPIRPCNSYDLFSRLEREYILQILLGYRPTLVPDDVFDARRDGNYAGPPLPSRYSDLSLPSDWYCACGGASDDGAYGGDPMARRISAAWSAAEDEIRIFCAAASAALAHPGRRKHTYYNCVRRTRRKRGRGEGKAVRFAESPLDVSEVSTESEGTHPHYLTRDRRRRRTTGSDPPSTSTVDDVRSSEASWVDLERQALEEARRASIRDLERSVRSQQEQGEYAPYWDDPDALDAARRASIDDLARSVRSQQEQGERVPYWDDLDALREARRASIQDLERSIQSQQEQGEDVLFWDDLDALNEARRASIKDLGRSVRSQQGVDGCKDEDKDATCWDDLDDVLEVGLRRSIEDLSSRVVERQERRLNRYSMRGSFRFARSSCRDVQFHT